jgi:hypothetical protein
MRLRDIGLTASPHSRDPTPISICPIWNTMAASTAEMLQRRFELFVHSHYHASQTPSRGPGQIIGSSPACCHISQRSPSRLLCNCSDGSRVPVTMLILSQLDLWICVSLEQIIPAIPRSRGTYRRARWPSGGLAASRVRAATSTRRKSRDVEAVSLRAPSDRVICGRRLTA